jgi:hypothetical protein
MAIINLIYVSSSYREIDADELDQILEASNRRNMADQITGMLLYAGGSFMQVLEGEEAVVDATFARIENDPRHFDVFVLERAPIEQRSFDRWSMGFRRLSHADVIAHPAYAPFFSGGFDAASIGARPGLALEMLKDFGLNQR